MTTYAIGLTVPLGEVLEDDEIVETRLGENAQVDVLRRLTIQQALEYASLGKITLPQGQLRISKDRVLRRVATGQVHIEINQEWG